MINKMSIKMGFENKKYEYLFKFIIILGFYFATGKLGLSLDAVNRFAALVWMPAGIALASLLLYGYKIWPAITLGAFLVNFTTGASLLASLGIAAGNTLEAIIGYYILKKVNFQNSFNSIKDMRWFVFVALTSAIVSAFVGVSSLYLDKLISNSDFLKTMTVWWFGDFLGILIVTSLILIWFSKTNEKKDKINEVLILIFLLLIINTLVFGNILNGQLKGLPIAYLIYPVLIWAALKFSKKWMITSVFITSAVAITGTVMGFGPFATEKIYQSLFLLQLFIGITFLIFLFLSITKSSNIKT